MEDIDEIVREFLVESYENLDQLDRDLVALEESPGSRELLSSIFRTIHTIKGTSGFLAFGRLERVTHVGENLLVELRDGERSMDQRTTDVLLRMTDCVRDILDAHRGRRHRGRGGDRRRDRGRRRDPQRRASAEADEVVETRRRRAARRRSPRPSSPRRRRRSAAARRGPPRSPRLHRRPPSSPRRRPSSSSRAAAVAPHRPPPRRSEPDREAARPHADRCAWRRSSSPTRPSRACAARPTPRSAWTSTCSTRSCGRSASSS